MMLIRNAAIVSMVGLLIALTGSADAARAKAKQSHTINGIVVNHHSKPVAGARVHVEHHHRHSNTAAAGTKTGLVRPKVARTHVHHGVMTSANGAFSLRHRHTGSVTLVAHKKNVGTGHARVVVGSTGSTNVTIRLHKHHHHHS